MQSEVHGAALGLEGLTLSYGEHVAVSNVALDVRAGEFVTLLGPSGSGKTTTLNLIAGFLSPDAGRITLDGEAVEKLPPNRRNIGMVFQHYALFPHMSAFENVAFPLRRRRVRKAEVAARVGAALDLVHLRQFANQYPSQLSGGQQQRIAFARAVVYQPRLLLMDEPLGALDRRLRETLQVEIRHLYERLGITFIYVTHDQDEALALSERIAVFNEGHIEQLGTPSEVYERPATLFVANFLGDSTTFPGELCRDGVTATVSCAVGSLRVSNPTGMRVGESCVIMVRPEHIRIRAADVLAAEDDPSEDNTVSGTVAEVTYFGATERLEVALAEGRRATVTRRVKEGLPPGRGDDVRLSWRPEDAVLLAAESAEQRGSVSPTSGPSVIERDAEAAVGGSVEPHSQGVA
jgi:putative spermidine/putrescine transport system ATP-binding protein